MCRDSGFVLRVVIAVVAAHLGGEAVELYRSASVRRPQQGDATDPAAIDPLSVQTRGQHGESEDVEAGAVLRAFAPHELVSPDELNLPQPDGTFVPIKRGPITSTLIAVCEAAVGPRSGTQGIAGRLSRVETCSQIPSRHSLPTQTLR